MWKGNPLASWWTSLVQGATGTKRSGDPPGVPFVFGDTRMPSPSTWKRLVVADGIPSATVEYGSVKFYALCGFGGVLSCGLTHTAVADPQKYKGILNGFSVTLKEDGFRGLAKGWAPTLIGYSLQGLCKFGFYEVFKVLYSNMLGEENAYLWRTSLYLAASASAEHCSGSYGSC
ncbi:hypothetical protein FD754_024263 [Muntiacus muntjak]|uniref:Solute carrier family 25 member 3 n=1 Tax=Muntiacus muntjak TaxID=9888 RepID=A0A5N3UPG4_MUNMU|nr:hypothetical protein FD754_024461 [Muntiacus muntjak]KAB0338605.1 hypothetical protein FD754_024460 [Muntiacus muntjak]KAB0338899.1 hypothetical protein FD754_024264 [Muntiacus muntjak]KAB0338900.1 hypothetical protein FD754_024265 [Muntiacus muntjak]KAB0338902.1 hypothetical protein FD754_024262 [Muntiacus muntjak]